MSQTPVLAKPSVLSGSHMFPGPAMPLKRQAKVNILYINSSSVLFGAERRLFDIIDNLDKENFRFFAVLPDEGPLVGKLKEKGGEVFVLDFAFSLSFRNIFKFFRLTKDFLTITRKEKIDIVHLNQHRFSANFWLAFFLARRPVVMSLREHAWIEIFEKFVAGRFSRIICVSRFIRESFLEKRRSDFLTHNDHKKVSVLYDGIDTCKFSKRADADHFREEIGAGTETVVVGVVGAIDPVKGQDIFVLAAAEVCRFHPATKFVIVGDLYMPYNSSGKKKRYKEGIIRMISDLGLEKNIFMAGFRENIPEIMNTLDILVQPSLKDALGGSMIEAMACSKPVIGTRIEGTPEVIGADGAGIIVEPKDHRALAKAMIFYIENPQAAKRAGIIGRKRVEQYFDLKKNMEAFEDIYNEACADKSCKRTAI